MSGGHDTLWWVPVAGLVLVALTAIIGVAQALLGFAVRTIRDRQDQTDRRLATEEQRRREDIAMLRTEREREELALKAEISATRADLMAVRADLAELKGSSAATRDGVHWIMDHLGAVRPVALFDTAGVK